MSKKNLPIFLPMFDYVIFFFKQNWLCQYKLKNNFFFFLPFNNLYSKFNIKSMLKFSKFVLKTYSQHWFRISFRGKGFRLRKFKEHNKLTLNFGHSHWAKVALTNFVYFVKKIRRQNYLCVAKNYYFYKNFKNNLKFFKKINTYTKRGLRLKKQFIKKRFGKISQVVSSLH